MEIYEGVCYRTADGRNTGPMTCHDGLYRSPLLQCTLPVGNKVVQFLQIYHEDGTVWAMRPGEEGHQIVGLWQPITEEDIKELV